MMKMVYQVKENTEDIKQLKAQNSEQEERIAQLEAQLKALQAQVKPIETFNGFAFQNSQLIQLCMNHSPVLLDWITKKLSGL